MTRLCDLPWRGFIVDTQPDPPRARPCRQYPDLWNARDFEQIDAGLGRLRLDLIAGTPTGACRSCPATPPGTVTDLADLLERRGLPDGNRMLDALRVAVGRGTTAPPADLTYRVAHTRDAVDFLFSGIITVFDFMPFIERYDHGVPVRLLDWGCGSGRMSLPIAEHFPDVQLTGCDIDAEAVAWCRDHIPGGEFRVIDSAPPTSFERGAFTSIIGYSIVTHLSRELQRTWVDELHRLLADDGIVVMTTMGETAARITGVADRLESEGILDDRLDTTLDAVMPPGYYRSTFQSRTATEALWGARFELLDFVAGGAFGYQDVFVWRRRPSA